MKRHNFIKISLVFLLSVISIIPTNSYCSAAKTTSAPSTPNFKVNPEDMKKAEKVMNGMQAMYENFSPEERKEFETIMTSAVEEEGKKLAAMTPEQQEEYFKNAMQALNDFDLESMLEQFALEEDAKQNYKQDKVEEKPASKDKDQKKEESEKEAAKKRITETINLINQIVKAIDSFFEKLSGVKGGMQNKVEKWIKDGKLQIETSTKIPGWTKFKNDVLQMKQKLIKLKKTDAKTGKYEFLDDVKNIDKIYGQLDMLASTLKKYEPIVKIASEKTLSVTDKQVATSKKVSGGKFESESAKSATKILINNLSDSAKSISISADEIINKFEKEVTPKRAQEAKKKETAAASRAKSATKVSKSPTRSAGTRVPYDEDYGVYLPDEAAPNYYPQFSDYGSGYGAQDIPDSYYSSWPQQGSTGNYSSPDYGKSTAGTTPNSTKDSSKTESLNEWSKPDSEKTTTNDKKSADTKTTTAAPKTTSSLELIEQGYPKISNQINKIIANLDEFEDNYKDLKKDKLWQTLPDYIASGDKDDRKEALIAIVENEVERLRDIKTSIEKVLKETVEKVKEANIKTAIKDRFVKKLKAYEQIEKDIKAVIEKISEKSKSIKNISDEARKAKFKASKEIFKGLGELSEIRKILG